MSVSSGVREGVPVRERPAPPTRKRARLRSAARTRGSKKAVTWIVVFLVLTLVVALYARTHSPDAPTSPRAQGYVGEATNTGVLSPDWASGIETAWTLPALTPDGSNSQSVFVEGTTMYVAVWETVDSLQVAAYDIASAQPHETWVSRGDISGEHGTSDAPHVVSAGEWLAVDSILVSKETGSQQQAPWGEDTPMAFVDEVVVTCSFLETCSGWTIQSGSWTRLWRTITARQSRVGDAWKNGGGRVVGLGEEASVLVPVDHHYNLQLINARTGEVATLGESGPVKLLPLSDFRLTLDGVIVLRSYKTMEAYDATGRLVDMFEEDRKARAVVPSEDGRAPTLAELTAFFSDGKAPWATGTALIVGDDCSTLTFTPTADYPPRSIEGVKQLSMHTDSTCYFSPTQLRASTDGSALFVWSTGWENDRIAALNMVNNTYHTVTLPNVKDMTWAFDDLLIVTSKTGITALTPSSSGA